MKILSLCSNLLNMSIFKRIGSPALFLILGFSCIGTDFQDDPIVDPKIELQADQKGLRVTEQTQLTPRYFDEFGLDGQSKMLSIFNISTFIMDNNQHYEVQETSNSSKIYTNSGANGREHQVGPEKKKTHHDTGCRTGGHQLYNPLQH